MERRNELIITIVLLIIFMVFIFNMMGNISLATGENTTTTTTITNSIGGGDSIMKPGSYLSPYPVFNNYSVSNENFIVKIPENTTVRQLLNDISIKLSDDEQENEWKLTELPQTYIDENGEQKEAVNQEADGYLGKATFGIYLNKEEHGIYGDRDWVLFWITNLKGEKLEIDDVIGTGTKIEWGSAIIGGEFEAKTLGNCSITGDVTGDGTSNIYDITGLVSLIYDQPEDYQWNPAVKAAAIVTEQEKDEPDIYDIQQMVVNNFDN